MHFPTKHEPTGGRVYTSFLAQLLRNYLFGSTVAVVGVGGALVFSTLSVPSNERFALGAIMAISLIIMIACELFVFYRHLLPIQAIFKAQQPTSEQLKTAYLHTHKFPVLSVRRTYGPHFLGLLLPAVSMAFVCIKLGFIKLPYFYIGIASAVAFMIASMHAMIEFFLTMKAIRPIVTHIRNQHKELYKQDITLSGRVLVSIRTKFRLSAFLIGTLPLMLFGLVSQIRLDNLQGEGSLAYWQWAAIILIIGIIYSLFGASLLSRSIEDPIHTIQNGMSSVQAGNFDTSAADIYSDEFSKLVAGFNHMVNGLKEREQRNNQLLQSYFMTLAAALDARDAYTAGHSTRVARYSVQIGRLDGWSADEIELLHKTALLHDIGKIGVRDAVLLKEGRLTDEEFDQIKLHPVLGENILKQIEPADAMADLLPGVRSHHERYDGKGYPDGLAGTEIPLFGRAIAIADAFDAMTSDRPYRKGMTDERALSILEEGKGTQWDPKLTQLFIGLMRAKGKTDEEAS